MANFNFSFKKMIKNEGGYILHKNKGDSGGWTYAGIAENFWPNWEGWTLVKSGKSEESHELVKKFYIENFWNKIKGDRIKNDSIAYNIFDFGVNTGVKKSAKLAQKVVGAVEDGVIGNQTLKALNECNVEMFELKFTIEKIKRYIKISKNKNKQFFRGWIIRSLRVLEG